MCAPERSSALLIACLSARDALGWQCQQRGTAAGKQEDHPVAFLEVADQLQYAACDALAGIVRHRVCGLHHLDAAAVGVMFIAGHHQAGEFAFPDLLNGFGHGRSRLAGADDDGSAAAVFGQMVGEHMARMGGLDGAIEQLAQQGLGIDGHLWLLGSFCRGRLQTLGLGNASAKG